MAPVLPPPIAGVVTITPWPIFTVFGTDGHPLVGGRLWTFDANTTTEKPAYHDPYLLSPHTNPIILDAFGQATVWLDGYYHLFLEDADGVDLWDVDNYTFETGMSPPSGVFVGGQTDVTLPALSGQGVLQGTGLVPLGYRCEGVIARIPTTFGASQGLQYLLIGDNIYNDRWGQIGRDAGLEIGQRNWHVDQQPIAATAYTVLVSAIGGTFDTSGQITLRAFWSAVTGWS